MGKIKEAKPVKLIMGVIACCAGTAEEDEGLLVKKFGSIDARSAVTPFGFTDYYENEMGKNLLRVWISFEKLVDPQELAGIKTETNKIEEKLSVGVGFIRPEGAGLINQAPAKKRRVNLDPGYIDGGKLVLASTKNYSHRIYLSKGIYAEVTLIFEKSAFRPLAWTYPDYKSVTALDFLVKARSRYLAQLKKA